MLNQYKIYNLIKDKHLKNTKFNEAALFIFHLEISGNIFSDEHS